MHPRLLAPRACLPRPPGVACLPPLLQKLPCSPASPRAAPSSTCMGRGKQNARARFLCDNKRADCSPAGVTRVTATVQAGGLNVSSGTAYITVEPCTQMQREFVFCASYKDVLYDGVFLGRMGPTGMRSAQNWHGYSLSFCRDKAVQGGYGYYGSYYPGEGQWQGRVRCGVGAARVGDRAGTRGCCSATTRMKQPPARRRSGQQWAIPVLFEAHAEERSSMYWFCWWQRR